MTAGASRRVAVLAAVRTPIGRYGGSLRGYRAPELGVFAARAALERSGVAPTEIEEVVFGHGIQAGVGQNPARQVLRGSGIPDEVGAVTVNMVCGSGMKAVHLGEALVRAGDFDRVLVGGMESMSNAPFLVDGSVRWGVRPGARTLDDSMQWDSLIDAYDEHELMGFTGERIAEKFGSPGRTSTGSACAAICARRRRSPKGSSTASRSRCRPIPRGGSRVSPGTRGPGPTRRSRGLRS